LLRQGARLEPADNVEGGGKRTPSYPAVFFTCHGSGKRRHGLQVSIVVGMGKEITEYIGKSTLNLCHSVMVRATGEEEERFVTMTAPERVFVTN
jgi:hypothetical protein